MLLALIAAAAIDLRLELVRESLLGTHYRYRQYVNGQAVAGGEVNVTRWVDGSETEVRQVVEDMQSCLSNCVSPIVHEGKLVFARREVIRVDEMRQVVRYVDRNGRVLLEQSRFAHATKPARVFDPNPVTKLNDPTLRDSNDSAAAVPASAYSDVILERLNTAGPLGGTYVQVVDTQAPAVTPVDSSSSLVFTRDASGFEDVNAYFHIDRTQQYLQSLGYSGGRTVVPYAVEVDTHAANGRDDSFFAAAATAGRGTIFLGEGGTDDAEDSDLVVHEYAHAIHEWISPGTFLGASASQGRAISEGFGDYWAFSASYDASIATGRDAFCFADWDARCAGDADVEQCAYTATSDCLRRLDSTKTMADYSTIDSSGTEHRNGEIWSSALREIFIALRQRHGASGKRIADTIVIESLFGAPPNPSFAGIARRMIATDQLLNGGANADVICAAMTRRGILTDCVTTPRGEITLFQSTEQGVAIPDDNSNGITIPLTVTDTRLIERLQVNVNIRHTLRGDLRLVLVAPDGSETVLQNFSNDRAQDIVATYGRDALPVDSLDVYRGRSAAGTWKLRVSDVRPRDSGVVVSWSLAIQFAGDQPATSRPAALTRQIIPAAGHAPGASGTYWRSDVRLFASRDTNATLIFTPSMADGRTTFSAVRFHVPANTTIALDDIVSSLFATSGTGQIEIQGDVLAMSRTYTSAPEGTYGQAIPAVRNGVTLPRTPSGRVSTQYRSNLGVAETAGGSGVVRVFENDYPILPFGHFQIPIPDERDIRVEVTSGDARITTYTSIVDNSSGDPSYYSSASTVTGMLPAIRSAGAFATVWRTEVVTAPMIPLQYSDKDGTRTFTPAVARTDDVLGEWFGVTDSRGILSGAISRSRIYTTGPKGTYGTAVTPQAPFSGTRQLLHIDNTESFRTNIGLMTGAQPAAIVVTLFDAAGRQLRRSEHLLRENALEQFQLTEPVTNGRVQVEVVDGVAAAYASVVDNRSGDSIFVPAQ